MAAPKYIKNASGVLTEQAAAVVSAADSIVATGAGGVIDVSFLPSGVGPDTVVITASEALSAGDFVNIWNSTGVKVRKADASASGKRAHGFVLAAVSSSAAATVYLAGVNDQVTSVTIADQWLSVTTPGGFQATAPTVAGQVSQKIGVAVSTTKISYQPQPEIVLA